MESKGINESFLLLVRLGLDVSDETAGESINDWDALRALAIKQGLQAIVLDGLERLPLASRPPKEKLLQWIGLAMQEEQRFAIQEKASCELALLLESNGLKTYVLKGMVVSECYPKPHHRTSVDLDCFLQSDRPSETWEKGNKVVESAGYVVHRDYYKNSTWLLPGLTVENHKWLTPFRGNKKLTSLERLLQTMLREDAGDSVFEGTALHRPPVLVSALFLIEHAFSHFLHEGLTWRHVLDWMMFSRTHKDEIDWPQLDAWIDEYGFRKFYDSYHRLSLLLLGELEEENLTPVDQLMLADIWSPLDLHETVRGVRGKLALVGNTWRARWKYRHFAEINWLQALWIQVVGFLFMHSPELEHGD